MSKNVLVISTSPRRNGNSKLLADAFANGARQAGNSVENISLHDKTICFCKGCLSCQKSQRCVIHDDADTIAQKMRAADVLVFATPIYYYGMSGQMKTMLDRGNPLYASDYAFREVYLLAAAAEEEEHTMDGAVNGLRGWLACFPKARLAGTVFGAAWMWRAPSKNTPLYKKLMKWAWRFRMAERLDPWGGFYQNLIDAGCSQATAQQCVALARGEKKADLLRLLSHHRAALLDAVHANQKRIDCLDYLLYRIGKEGADRR